MATAGCWQDRYSKSCLCRVSNSVVSCCFVAQQVARILLCVRQRLTYCSRLHSSTLKFVGNAQSQLPTTTSRCPCITMLILLHNRSWQHLTPKFCVSDNLRPKYVAIFLNILEVKIVNLRKYDKEKGRYNINGRSE